MPTQPAFQTFLLLLLLSAGHAKATPISSAGAGPSFRLPLFERDNLSFSPDNDYPRRLEARMERDALRVSSLIRRLSSGDGSSTAAYKVEEYKTGVSVISGIFAVTIGVGTPPQTQTLAIDTGSDLVWVQCLPCDSCYIQGDPIFDPSKSTSFSTVPCKSEDDLLCQQLDKDNRGCDRDRDRCTYKYGYADDAQTEGILATENITFGTTTVPGMPIGCGRKNEKLNMGEGGMMGLGGGTLSFVGGKLGVAFSYCLGWSSNGWLEIGPSNFPTGATWVPMIRNPKYPSFYYVGLLGIAVGGEAVKIPDGTFQINKDNEGGVIMDTGTTGTYLPKAAYEPFRDMFKAKMANVKWAPKYYGFDTCFYPDSGKVPDVSFIFSGGLTLNITNSIFQGANGEVCFGFAPSSATNFAIIGSLQQQGIRISIDGTGWNIGFGPDGC